MVIELFLNTDGNTVNEFCNSLQNPNRIVKELIIDKRKFLIISGDKENIDVEKIKSLPFISFVSDKEISAYFCSRSFKEEPSIVNVNGVNIGHGSFRVIAGPCAVENKEDLFETAKVLKELGADIFRAGAYKPRTTPYNFQGMGEEGLKLLAEVRKRYDIPVVSEILDPFDIPMAEKYLDMIQVGTRNMTNQALLKHLGKCSKPILLKRGYASTIEDLIKAAEFIAVNGNPNVILCERGIQTFEKQTRNTLDISAIPILHSLSHLPVVVDPSHAAGRKDIIPTLVKCAIVAGADAIMVEAYNKPDTMIRPGDKNQTLTIDEFKKLMETIKKILPFKNK
ncbi:MAG: bifunctional 3-deoxy-7-phosphoheptulonate synthase/chorismate mutase [Bacteroidales bacterium]|nr:bifunctional 3-deoxy-7-phosphoheptulonate synthase/chorismate mutase [Bacteroidales bacterium]